MRQFRDLAADEAEQTGLRNAGYEILNEPPVRSSWVYRNGELVEKGGPKDVRIQPPRSSLPCPMLITDDMPAAEHVDGRFYTSKSEFRKVTRANGLTEVGTEKINRPRPKVSKAEREAGINKAVEMAASRVGL